MASEGTTTDHGSDAVHAAIRSIYDAATAPERWPQALQAIADCTDDVGTVLMWRRDDGGFGTIVSPALEASQADYLRDWAMRDIRAARMVERGFHIATDCATDGDVVDDDEIDDLPIYRDFLIPHGLGWFAATSVAPDPRIVVAISVQRRHDRPRFDAAELRLVAQLGRHVEQSLRIGIRLFDGNLKTEGLANALSSMNIGVFGLDSLGRVTLRNPAAETLLGAGLTIRNDRLSPTGRSDREAFEAEFARIRAEGAPLEVKPLLIGEADDAQRLVVHLLPVSTEQMFAGAMLAETRVLALVVGLDRKEPIAPTVLRDLLGLTLNEARIASLVGAGLQPRAVADHLGIAEETARSVLKRVFAKTGVSRQAELVGLLARLSLGR